MSEHTTEDTINRLKSLTEKLCLVQDRITIDHAVIEIQTAIAEAVELRAERDEARRRVCEDAIWNGRVYRRVGSDTVRCETSKEVAEMMGWDCFKEER